MCFFFMTEYYFEDRSGATLELRAPYFLHIDAPSACLYGVDKKYMEPQKLLIEDFSPETDEGTPLLQGNLIIVTHAHGSFWKMEMVGESFAFSESITNF